MSSLRVGRLTLAGLCCSALLLSLTTSSPSAQQAFPAGQTGAAPAKPGEPQPLRYFEGRVLVKSRAGARLADLAPLHAGLGARVTDTFARIGNLQVVELPRGLVTTAAAVQAYQRSPLVQYAEPDYEVRLAQSQVVPNDPSLSSLWGLHNTGQSGGTVDADIDAPEAWAVTSDASNVVVGVVDTGIDYTHPDLAGNMWQNPGEVPGDGVDNDGNGYVDDVYGINCITRTGNPWDDHYHGTHVAGTIGATGNNGVGVAGVTWRVRLMALKFLSSSGSGSTSDAIRCLDYAQAKGAHLTNNSWGGGGFDQALYDAINANRQAGMLFVAAAGNSSANTDSTVFYPAGYALDNVVAVAASTRNDQLASFSNYGYGTVELAAPGLDIYSTYPNNSYAMLSGTSMASPHVTGALALLKAYRTDLTTYPALIAQLLGTTDKVPALANASRTGGRLNLYRLLTGTPMPVSHLTVNPSAGAPGTTVSFTDGSFGEITSRSLDFGDGSAPTSQTTTTHQYVNAGTYTATLTVNGPNGTDTRSRTIVIRNNYRVESAPFAWVDTSGFMPLTLTDDSSSSAIALPFTFPYYEQNYTTLYVGSNGLLTLGTNVGVTAYSNTALPSASTPNAAIYAYWDDLNPGVGGGVRHGLAPDGSYVVSWEAVPHYANNAVTLTFQAVLEPAGGIRLQYFEVRSSDLTYGGGRSATVGVEDAPGAMAKQYSFNGSTVMANGTAIRFSAATGAPDGPGGLRTDTPTSSAVNLYWADLSTTETGFWVQRKAGTTDFSTIATLGANSTSYSSVNLSPATTYVYRVAAFNDAGTAASNEVTVTTADAPPAAPSNLATTGATTASVSLSWTDNSSSETEFRVQRAPSGSLVFTQVGTSAANDSTFVDTAVSAGTAYSYRVVAANASGVSGVSNTVAATTVPAAPVLTQGTVTATSVAMTWTNVAGETGYSLRRSWSDGSDSVALGSTATSYTWTGLSPETAYTFVVAAQNASGESVSNAIAPTTLTQAPVAPTGLTVSVVSFSALSLAWTDNATTETSYEVERAQGTGAFAWIATLGAGTTAYADISGLSPATTYSYRVFAVRNAVRSTASNTASGTTASSGLVAPTWLPATTVASTSLTLNWSPVNGASGYEVQRLTGRNTWSTIGTPTASTFPVSGLSPRTSYSFRVRATGGGTQSPYSSTLAVKTTR